MKPLFPYYRHRFQNELILEDLPSDVLDILLRKQDIIAYGKNEIVFREGVNAQGVFYVRSGLVKKYSVGYQGREYVFYLSGEREILGHHGLMNNEPNPNSAMTVQESELVFIPKRDFMRAMEVSPEFQSRIMGNLSHEFGVFVHYAKILAQYNVRERTALSLLIVNEKFLRGGSLDAIIQLSREDLASMVGTAKENLVRVLSDFKREGYIETKGRDILIKDFDALINLSNYFD